LGNGNGTFQSAVNYTTGESPVSIAIGDFNNSGIMDLAVSGAVGILSILPGNGDGTFQSPTYYVSGDGSYGIALFTSNGETNVAVADEFGGRVTILSNSTP
jgi:hypothetical protein